MLAQYFIHQRSLSSSSSFTSTSYLRGTTKRSTTTTTSRKHYYQSSSASASKLRITNSSKNKNNKNISLPPGLLVAVARGSWNLGWKIMMSQLAPNDSKGNYLRPLSEFRLSTENSSPEAVAKRISGGKFFLFASKTCPWAQRTLITLKIKNINKNMCEVVYLEPNASTGLWEIPKEDVTNVFRFPDDDQEKIRTLRDAYSFIGKKKFSGRATAPLLIHRKDDDASFEILCNESADIIRLLDCLPSSSNVDEDNELKLYAKEKREEIDEMCSYLFENINNGVYRVGFAQTQTALDDASEKLFNALDVLENKLLRSSTREKKYLCGDTISIADVCFFTTLIRFDSVYNHLFKCNKKKISEYKNLTSYLKDLYSVDAFRTTTDIEKIRAQYYSSLFPINPGGLIPPLPATSSSWMM